MRKVKMTVHGRVQGVGFRYMTKLSADRIGGVYGEVWNNPDGTVGIIAMGEEEKMDVFIRLIKTSPSPSGRVDQVDITEAPELPESRKFRVTSK